jgi:hypothetical protein
VSLLGALVAVWGALVLGLAKPLHVRWKGMLSEIRRAGIEDSIPLTRFFASESGLRWLRVIGGAALAVGLAMVAAGLLRG